MINTTLQKLKEKRDELGNYHDFINCYEISDLTAIMCMGDMNEIYTDEELAQLPAMQEASSEINDKSYTLLMFLDDEIELMEKGEKEVDEEGVIKLMERIEEMKGVIQKASDVNSPFIDKLPMKIKANLD